jgi:integrase
MIMNRPEDSPSLKQRKKQKFEPYKVRIGGKTMWQVNLESETGVRDGRRVRVRPRRTFSNVEEARSFAALKRIERKNRGTLGVSMPEKLRADALEAARLLEPFGASLLDAVQEYVERRELSRKSETVTNAFDSFMKARQGDNLRDRYVQDLHYRLGRFAEAFGERKVADIESGEIYAWLRDLGQSPLSRNTYHLRLSVFFEYCHVRGWLVTNPVKTIPRAKVPQDGPVGILSVEQVARLLEAANPETLPYWAIGAFCGLRNAELRRLEWKDVHWDEKLLEVPSLKSKTASRRFVSIRDNVASWLEPYRGRIGMICPTNLYARLIVDRRAAGVSNWPANGLRHSFASYHLAAFRDPRELALEMGHTRSEITFRHYRELVRPAEAERFWKIAPAIHSEPKLAIVA